MNKELIGKINDYIGEHKLSYRKFAKLCGVSKDTMSHIVNGVSIPKPSTVVKINYVINKEE